MADEYEMSAGLAQADANDLRQLYINSGGAPINDYWGAHFSSSLNASMTKGLVRDFKASELMREAEDRPDRWSELASTPTEEEWSESAYYRPGMKYDASNTLAKHIVNAQQHDERQRAEIILNDSPIGFRSLTGIAVDFGAGALDPINWLPFGKVFTAGKELGMLAKASSLGFEGAVSAGIAHEVSMQTRIEQGEVFEAGALGNEILMNALVSFGIHGSASTLGKAMMKTSDAMSAYFGGKMSKMFAESVGVKESEARAAEMAMLRSELSDALKKEVADSGDATAKVEDMNFDKEPVDIVEKDIMDGNSAYEEYLSTEHAEPHADVAAMMNEGFESMKADAETMAGAPDMNKQVDPEVASAIDTLKRNEALTRDIMERCM